MTGIVKMFNDSRGYGWIQSTETEALIFVHYTAIQGEGYKHLIEGQSVEFEVVAGPKGPQAIKVRAAV